MSVSREAARVGTTARSNNTYHRAVANGLLNGKVVVCGSGISIDAPSHLPNGDRLAAELFDLVCTTGPLVFPPSALAAVRLQLPRSQRGLWEGLRLELVFDILARELDPRVLVQIYGLLRSTIPNRNHYGILLARPRAVLTTNQDMLLEKAARVIGGTTPDVLHLHGRCDRPSTIVTLISQYVRGLQPKIGDALQSSVLGRDVVVLGYSGRDRDVMPALIAARPRSVLWIQHRSDVASAPELDELKAQLPRRTVTVLRRHTSSWIRAQLAPRLRDRASQLAELETERQTSVSKRTARAFERFEPTARNLAVGRLLEHIGRQQQALAGYRTMLLSSRLRDCRVAIRVADLEEECDQYPAAIQRYRQIRRDRGNPADLRATALLGEINALRNSSNFGRADTKIRALLAEVSALPPSRQRRLTRGWALAHLAGNLRMGGEEEESLDYYTQAERVFQKTGSIDGLISVLYYRADLYRSRGEYALALEDLSRALTDGELFSRANTMPWPAFYNGQTLCATGAIEAGLAELRRARRMFTKSPDRPNYNGEAWALLMEASYLRERNRPAAHRASVAAARAIRSYKAEMAYGTARLWWERAEMSRARGEHAAARRSLTRYRRYIERFPGPPVYLTAHGDAIEAELARECADPDALALIEAVRQTYESLGAQSCAARMAVSAWLIEGGPPPRDLVRRCREKRYGLEAARLAGRDRRRYFPLHVM